MRREEEEGERNEKRRRGGREWRKTRGKEEEKDYRVNSRYLTVKCTLFEFVMRVIMIMSIVLEITMAL
jgi:hypothetical protein